MPTKHWGNAYRTTVVCVDEYEGRILRGRIYNPHLPEGAVFRSTVDFLLRMEDLLDDMRFPQSFSAVRTFRAAERMTPPAEPPGRQEGRCATFAVRVLFRQNASWQGSLTWLEEDREESFRSVLELLLLMHSALEPET